MDIIEENVEDLVSGRKGGFPPVYNGDINHGDHIKLKELRSLVSKNSEVFSKFNFDLATLNRMKKFAVVRNPYERTLSLFSFMQRSRIENYTPNHFLNDLINFERWADNYHTFQSEFFLSNDGELLVDRVFKIEDNFLSQLSSYLNLPLSVKDNSVNVTGTRKHNNAEYFLNSDVVSLIQQYFEQDFIQLGYSANDYPK